MHISKTILAMAMKFCGRLQDGRILRQFAALVPNYFLLNQIIVTIVHIFDIIFFFAAELEEPKISI